MPSSYYAHSENRIGIKHDLVEYLKSVARLAPKFAGKFGAADLGYWAGLWHDMTYRINALLFNRQKDGGDGSRG